MKTVRNKTTRPMRLTLPGGGVLHLGPRREGQIQDNAVEWAGIQRHLEAGEIEILDTGSEGPQRAGGNSVTPETHGHHQKSVHTRGDR